MRAIIVGRHTPTRLDEFEIIEQKNITFPATSQECERVLETLITDAQCKHAALLFQVLPSQAHAALHRCDWIVPIGFIISVPGPRPADIVYDLWTECPHVAGEIVKTFVPTINPRAKVHLGSALHVIVEVDPPMRFEFSHIEWLTQTYFCPKCGYLVHTNNSLGDEGVTCWCGTWSPVPDALEVK